MGVTKLWLVVVLHLIDGERERSFFGQLQNQGNPLRITFTELKLLCCSTLLDQLRQFVPLSSPIRGFETLYRGQFKLLTHQNQNLWLSLICAPTIKAGVYFECPLAPWEIYLALIGCCYYLGFNFTALDWKALINSCYSTVTFRNVSLFAQ